MNKIIPFLLAAAAAFSAADSVDFNMKLSDLDGKSVTLKEFKGKKLILLYFSTTCPSCRQDAEYLAEVMKSRPCVTPVGIITSGDPEKDILGQKGRIHFPGALFYDRFKAFKAAFKFERVPRTVFADEKGAIKEIIEEFYPGNFKDVFDLNLAGVCGMPPYEKTMKERYYGASLCRYCHAEVYDWWKATPHGEAFKVLSKRYFRKSGYRAGDEKKMDPEYLRYATTGFGEEDGYSSEKDMRHLQGVQCEQCHSRAGPHDGRGVTDYEAACVRCHTSTRDPLFEYRKFLKKMGHP